jgi:hypothetical protein
MRHAFTVAHARHSLPTPAQKYQAVRVDVFASLSATRGLWARVESIGDAVLVAVQQGGASDNGAVGDRDAEQQPQRHDAPQRWCSMAPITTMVAATHAAYVECEGMRSDMSVCKSHQT